MNVWGSEVSAKKCRTPETLMSPKGLGMKSWVFIWTNYEVSWLTGLGSGKMVCHTYGVFFVRGSSQTDFNVRTGGAC